MSIDFSRKASDVIKMASIGGFGFHVFSTNCTNLKMNANVCEEIIVEITWNKTMSVWWSHAWRLFVYAFAAGAVGGALAAGFRSAGDAVEPSLGQLAFLNVVILFFSLIAMKQALTKHFSADR